MKKSDKQKQLEKRALEAIDLHMKLELLDDPNSPTCNHCRFWRGPQYEIRLYDGTGRAIVNEYGFCHRFPPDKDGFKKSCPTAFCGEFSAVLDPGF